MPRRIKFVSRKKIRQDVYCFAVTVRTLSLYTRCAARSDVAYLSEILTGIYVRNVHFNGRYADCLECIGNCYACVRVCRRIHYYAVNFIIRLLDLIDDISLMVRLKEINLNALFVGVILYFFKEIGIVLSAVNIRFSDAEHIDVRTVNNQNFHLLRVAL